MRIIKHFRPSTNLTEILRPWTCAKCLWNRPAWINRRSVWSLSRSLPPTHKQFVFSLSLRKKISQASLIQLITNHVNLSYFTVGYLRPHLKLYNYWSSSIEYILDWLVTWRFSLWILLVLTTHTLYLLFI